MSNAELGDNFSSKEKARGKLKEYTLLRHVIGHVSWVRKRGNVCAIHRMFLKNQNFFVSNFLSASYAREHLHPQKCVFVCLDLVAAFSA